MPCTFPNYASVICCEIDCVGYLHCLGSNDDAPFVDDSSFIHNLPCVVRISCYIVLNL